MYKMFLKTYLEEKKGQGALPEEPGPPQRSCAPLSSSKKYLISLLENHTLLVVQFFEVSVFKSATPIIRKV